MLTEWNDGCNECQVNTIPGGGLELGACTERFCFAPGDAFCMERGGGLAGAPPPGGSGAAPAGRLAWAAMALSLAALLR